ncbi:MAG: S-methyl-5'-thioadenosine phosphorylase [Dehalococcoidia bacterium]|nr:S-methyl-5'-thioadenosine phosphorylase [Dehalococcoidia bacterium]
MSDATIGIIGGSGLYQMDGLTDVAERKLDTPYGPTSDAIVLGTLAGRKVAFLPRHGRGHRINPTQVPYRANIYALKTLGVQRIVSINAVGSLREEMAPMDIVIPDQVIDRTRHRVDTFFENGIVAHVSLAEPFCTEMRSCAGAAAEWAGARVHLGGTYIAMEGPQFSTRAESQLYRSWGAHIIGMTALPEAKLAREAEMCYAAVAFVTDYDCWHPDHESVTTEMIIGCLLKGADTARAIVRRVIETLPESRSCNCGSALDSAIVTSPELVPAEVKKRLAPIAGRHLSDR